MSTTEDTQTRPEFETSRHEHTSRYARMSKAELAAHLTTPHLQLDGRWLSNCGPISALMKWRRDELEQRHAEMHP